MENPSRTDGPRARGSDKNSGGGWERLTPKPIVATTYVDTSVAAGRAYDFRVTAIDQSGNESAPGAEVHVAVP